MTAFLHDAVLDAALQLIVDRCDALYICSQMPTTYAEATATYALGTKAAPSVGAPQNGAMNGRRVVVSAIADGSVTAGGTASHFAMTDSGNSRLLAAQALAAPVAVTNGNSFSLTSLSITIPDAL